MAQIRTAAGLSAITCWRRVKRLNQDGTLHYLARTGGDKGSAGRIDYPGSLEQLVSLVRGSAPKEHHRQEMCTHCGRGIPKGLLLSEIRELRRQLARRPPAPAPGGRAS